MYSVTDSEFTITTKEWDLREHQNTMLDIWADPEWLLVYRNNQKVRHLTGPEYLLPAKSIKNIVTYFFYSMDGCLSELEKKNVGKNRCLLGLLSTSISASRILQKRLFCSFEDSIHCWQHQDFHAPSRPQDQDGSIGKHCQAVTQVLEIMTWLYKRNTNKTKISDTFVYAAYTHSIWYISLMHAMKLYFSDNWSIKQKIARKKGN